MNERPNATVKNCQALIICLVVFFFYYQSRYSASERVLHHSENEYGDLWVHERGGVRCISFAEPKETEVYQSCIMLDDPKRLVFNYTKMALGGLYLNPEPKQALLIGLGGASIADALQRMFPDTSIEVVEINPVIYEVAKKYFYFELANNTKVIIQDGISFLENAVTQKRTYDFIIVDAFNNNGVVPVFITEEFTRTVKSALAPGGVVVVNTLYDSEHDKIYKTIFGPFINLITSNSREIVAMNGELPMMDTIEANALHLQQKLEEQGVCKDWLMSILKQNNQLT